MARWRTGWIVGLLCLALLATACGGGAESSDEAAGGEAEATGDAAAAGTEGGGEAAPAETEIVSVGITSWHTWYWWLLAAREEGLFEPYGVELDVVTFQNTGQIASGIFSDSVQIGLIAPEQTFVLQDEQDTLKMIGANITTSPYTVLGGPEITTIEDLQGATLGVTAEGASADYFTALLILGSHGMEMGEDFSFVNAGPPAERAAAMSAGEIEAVLNFEPASLQLIEEGANVLDRAAEYDNLAGVEVNVLAADQSWYDENRDLAVRFAQGYLASLEWLYDEANRERAEELLATEMNITPEQATQTYERFVVELEAWDRDGQIDPERLEQTRANAVEAGNEGMPEEGDLDWRYDNSLMEEAAQAG
jgi:ABC-type nitrate/sulfonate/bicarbonate transport system substrate-binding protein